MNRRTFCNNILLPIPITSLITAFQSGAIQVMRAMCCLIDASSSMASGHDFFFLQKQAIASTLRDPCVAQRILNLPTAFSLIMWASADKQLVAIPWTPVLDQRTIDRLANRVDHIFWTYTGSKNNRTGLGMALFYGIEYMNETPARHAPERIINVSSNGKNNSGLDPKFLRERIFREGIEVNAIIMPGKAPTFKLLDLEVYYRQNVVTGNVLLPVAPGPGAHRRFVDGMVRKFCAEFA